MLFSFISSNSLTYMLCILIVFLCIYFLPYCYPVEECWRNRNPQWIVQWSIWMTIINLRKKKTKNFSDEKEKMSKRKDGKRSNQRQNISIGKNSIDENVFCFICWDYQSLNKFAVKSNRSRWFWFLRIQTGSIYTNKVRKIIVHTVRMKMIQRFRFLVSQHQVYLIYLLLWVFFFYVVEQLIFLISNCKMALLFNIILILCIIIYTPYIGYFISSFHVLIGSHWLFI